MNYTDTFDKRELLERLLDKPNLCEEEVAFVILMARRSGLVNPTEAETLCNKFGIVASYWENQNILFD